MTEYEWEVRRVPKAPIGRVPLVLHGRRHPISEYVALEFPRESVTWVTSRPSSAEEVRVPARERVEPRSPDSPSAASG